MCAQKVGILDAHVCLWCVCMLNFYAFQIIIPHFHRLIKSKMIVDGVSVSVRCIQTHHVHIFVSFFFLIPMDITLNVRPPK